MKKSEPFPVDLSQSSQYHIHAVRHMAKREKDRFCLAQEAVSAARFGTDTLTSRAKRCYRLASESSNCRYLHPCSLPYSNLL